MVTARRKAYNGIRHAIIFGHFRPGEQLKEEELSAKFNVSRTPVRQAIRQLSDEGLVFVGSNRRSYVTDISEAQAEEAFDLLAFLEGYAAKLAAVRITDEELQLLRQAHEKVTEVANSKQENDHAFMEVNSRFHEIIHEASGNGILSALLKRVSDLPYAMYLKHQQKTEDHDAITEHQGILKALSARDAVAAELQMRIHIEGVRSNYRAICRAAAPDSDNGSK